MKKVFFFILLCSAFISEGQNYSFSKNTGTYSNLNNSTSIINGSWDNFVIAIKIPFVFKYYDIDLTDSIYLNDFGSISLNNNNGEEISFLISDFTSHGFNQSPISYKTEGTSPNRIFKIEYNNLAFDADKPGLLDSAHVQVWLYETTNVMEFRYGPNYVKTTTWGGTGAFVGIINQAFSKFIFLEQDPSNPVLNTTDKVSFKKLNGMPANGTIYRFTPTTFPAGIKNVPVKINIIQHKIYLPSYIEVKQVNILNMNGQVIQSSARADDIDFSNFSPGVYIISVKTSDGLIVQKLVL